MQNTQNIQRNELFTVGLLLLQWSKDFLPKLRELPEAPDIITLLTLVEGSKRDEIPIAPSGSIYIKAATLWHMGEILKATKLLHEYLEGNPLDLVAIQVCVTMFYYALGSYELSNHFNLRFAEQDTTFWECL